MVSLALACPGGKPMHRAPKGQGLVGPFLKVVEQVGFFCYRQTHAEGQCRFNTSFRRNDQGIALNRETLPQRAARALRAQAQTIAAHHITIGLDGFVDEIISVVDKRESAEKFTRLPTMAAFGGRVSAAAGQSTNVELVVDRVKLGGNGPIMANAMAAF